MERKFLSVKLTQIDVAGSFQPRVETSEERAESYADEYRGGNELPALIVFGERSPYYLGDGFTRYRSHEILGRLYATCEVRPGGRREAMLYALGANKAHGYPPSNVDKRRAVVTMLRDPEWSAWKLREIAAHVGGVSHEFVRILQEEDRAGLLDENGCRRSGPCQPLTRKQEADRFAVRLKLALRRIQQAAKLVAGLGPEGERALEALQMAYRLLEEDAAGQREAA